MRRRSATHLAIAGAATLGLVVAAGLWWPRPAEIGADIAPPAAAGTDDGTVTIVILGTSLTKRYNWPTRLSRRLTGCLEKPVRVIPVARGGATSRWGAGQLARVVAPAPDVVLVEFAVNDADLRRGLSLTESARLHRHILRKLSERVPKAQVVLMSMSPAWGIKRLLRPWLVQYYALYPDLATESGAGFIDLFRRWMAYPARAGAFPDGVHPTDKATAEVTVPALLDYILAAQTPGNGQCQS
jgi:lysophospholipase L1-like esterase